MVTKSIELCIIRIVAGANCIEVVFLDHPQIPLHVLDADHRAGYGIGVVPVDTPELDGAAVQEHHVVLDVDLPQADAVGDDLVGSLDEQGVQVGLLCIPKNRL